MQKLKYLKSLVITGLLLLAVVSQAQTIPANAMQLAQAELQKRGLRESEVRERLLAEGINVDALQPAEFAAYQERIIAVLDAMEAEKKGAANPVTTGNTGAQQSAGQVLRPTSQPGVSVTAGNTGAVRQGNAGSVRQGNAGPVMQNGVARQNGSGNLRQGTSGNTIKTPNGGVLLNRNASGGMLQNRNASGGMLSAGARDSLNLWYAMQDSIAAEKPDSSRWKTPIYGHDFFANRMFEVVTAGDAMQVPDTYILGEGDVVHITLFGASQTDIQQRIAPDGSIKPANAPRIYLKGLSVAQARPVIRESLSRFYLFRDDQFALSVVTARTLLVNVLGEIRQAGGFYLSAVNSALNALSAAGGPTEIGSVRNIQLIRGTQRRTIDLYEFMNDPTTQHKMELQNNDILFVPPLGNVVVVEGAVKRPMRYEMQKKETLADLIRYAGGLAMNANPDYVHIQRFDAGREKFYEWNLADVLSGKVKVELLDGDIVRLMSVQLPAENYVEVTGSVHFPGKYDVESNPNLGAVLAKARLNSQAKSDRVFVERTRLDNTIELLSVAYEGPQTRFELQPKDKIRVLDLQQFGRSDTIYVSGEVKKPFRKVVSVGSRLSVGEAIQYAGGTRMNVYPVAWIFRKSLENPLKMTYVKVDLKKDSALLLQPGDSLNVYDNRTYTNIGQLSISGAVKRPGSFTFDASLSLRDLLLNAGGLNVGAAYNRIEVFRVVLSPTERTRLQLHSLQIDSSYNIVTPANFQLQPYDHVVVRMTPDFTLGRTMEINGQVRYPGIYVLESKETTLNDVIKMAGGLLNDADPYGARLFRTYKNRGNIIIQLDKAMKRSSKIRHNPILFEGDVLNINRMENTVTIMSEGTRIAQYSVDPETQDSMKVVIYQGRRSAGWYVRNYAGGFQKNVDRNSVSVTYPNNQMQSTKRVLFFRSYPKVEPGSIITMKMDAEKIEKENKPREKGDLERTLSTSLSTLMSTLSIILLMRQL